MSRQSSDGSIQMMTDEDNEIMKKNLLKLEKTEEAEQKKEFESFLTEWKQTRIKSIYPELQVQQLLTQTEPLLLVMARMGEKLQTIQLFYHLEITPTQLQLNQLI